MTKPIEELIQSKKEIEENANINQKKYEEISAIAEKEYADILKLL